MIAPLFGSYLIKVSVNSQSDVKDSYQSKFYKIFRRILEWCLEHKKVVLTATVVTFVFSLYMMKFIKQEFFPASLRPEIIVEMTLPEGSSIEASQTEATNFAKFLT